MLSYGMVWYGLVWFDRILYGIGMTYIEMIWNILQVRYRPSSELREQQNLFSFESNKSSTEKPGRKSRDGLTLPKRMALKNTSEIKMGYHRSNEPETSFLTASIIGT